MEFKYTIIISYAANGNLLINCGIFLTRSFDV